MQSFLFFSAHSFMAVLNAPRTLKPTNDSASAFSSRTLENNSSQLYFHSFRHGRGHLLFWHLYTYETTEQGIANSLENFTPDCFLFLRGISAENFSLGSFRTVCTFKRVKSSKMNAPRNAFGFEIYFQSWLYLFAMVYVNYY